MGHKWSRWQRMEDLFSIIRLHHFQKEPYPDSKVHGTKLESTWVLTALDGPHVGPMNLAIRDISIWLANACYTRKPGTRHNSTDSNRTQFATPRWCDSIVPLKATMHGNTSIFDLSWCANVLNFILITSVVWIMATGKIHKLRLLFDWYFYPRRQLTIFQYCFR